MIRIFRAKNLIVGILFFAGVFTAGLIWSQAEFRGIKDCYVIQKAVKNMSTKFYQ